MASENIYQKINEILENHYPAALVTVTEASKGSPRKAGAKMIVYGDGNIYETIGGGPVEAKVIDTAKKVISSGEPETLKVGLLPGGAAEVGAVCGGKMEFFIEPLVGSSPLIIFGAGHVAKALGKFAAILGFSTYIIDDREEWANPKRFKHAYKIFVESYESCLDKLPFGPDSYIVIVTRGHQFDREILEECITKPYKYLGMIGSRKKVEGVKEYLEKKGFSKEQIDNVHMPIGLAIGAETPEEIALSISAELVKVKYDNKF